MVSVQHIGVGLALQFEAIVHNTKKLNCRRGIDMFGEIVNRLAGMAERF